MDYSKFRRSQNVLTNDAPYPSSLPEIYGALGLSNTPSETISDMARALSHPATPYTAMKFGPGTLADQMGYNSPYWSQFGPLQNKPASGPIDFSENGGILGLLLNRIPR